MYKDLSLKEKAKVIREGVRLGLNSIDDILSLYDEAISYLQGDPIVSPYGQWKYPGRDTIIPSNNITMANVNYPVLGISDAGDAKIMMPWNDYKFKGSMVYEHPLIGNQFQLGGNTKPTFDLWYPTVPNQKNDTSSYDLRRAYNTLPFDEMEKFRTINDYHLPSVAYDEKTDTYTFLKRNGHPTLNYELDWYNSGTPDALEFRERYKLDTLSLPWRYVPNYAKGGSIHIDPKNKGKLTETMRRTGKSKYELAHSKNPLTRKRALFAINASHWKHLDGGYSDRLNNLNWKMHHSAGSDNIGSVWYNYTFDPENNYYNGTHYVGLNLLGKTQEQLPQGRDHVNLYTYGDETGFERINNSAPITVNGETYDYRLYYGNILPFDTIYLKPESLPVVDSMIKHKDLLGINTDYFIMDLNDAETYPKQYKNVFSHRNIKKGMPLDDTRAVSISPKKDENGYYLDAFDVIDYKKTTGFAGNRLDKIVEKENILNGPYILRQRVPVVFDKNKESNGPLLNLISQYKDNGMTWEEYLMKYSPSYNRIYGRHNQDAVSIEHKRSKGGHLFLENGYLQEAPKTFVAKQYDINLPLDWNAESWLGERADNYKGPKYTDEDIKIFESHVPEYRLIEENARNNGTWLKMSDGTTWNGDPRDWVLMQSKAFKNNYEDKVWYTGLAEWPTTVNYNGQDIQTDKVKRARYHNGLMWFSDNPGYALYFADYVDLKGLNSREWQYNPNGGYEKAPYINGMVFTAVIPKNSEIHSLLAPKEGTHDLWQKMPYVLTETGIERIPEYKLHQNKKGRNLINDDILNNKLITDDLVNHAENLGWKGLYMFNVDDGPVFINKSGKNYIPQESLHLEGVDTSRGTINEFISLPGLTEKLKFIHGNNGDFNPNIEDKYSYLTKDNYGNLIKFGGKIKK